MNTKFLTATGIACIVFVAGVTADEPIEGAFGKKFGAQYTEGLSEIRQGPRSAFRTSTFTPEQPLAGLSTYSISVTPVSHRIFEITAVGTLPSDGAVKALLSLLEAKFGPFASENRAMVSTRGYAHRSAGRIVHVSVNEQNQVVLTYRDGVLTATAREEGASGEAAEPPQSP